MLYISTERRFDWIVISLDIRKKEFHMKVFTKDEDATVILLEDFVFNSKTNRVNFFAMTKT